MIDKAAEALREAGVLESVAVTVKLLVAPDPVGVPVMAPVAASRVRPAGRLPDVSAQVTGAFPPLDASVDPG